MVEFGREALVPVEVIDGIGPNLARSMAALGVGSVQELAALRVPQARALADVLPGISPEGMRAAVAQAQFHLVSEDTGSLAAGLLAEGITDLLALIAAPTARIVTIGGDGWDTERALAVQLAAARVGMTFQVLLRVVDGTGAPVVAPRVEAVNSGLADRRPAVTHDGDDDGWVLTPALRRDRRHDLLVTAGGQRRLLRVVAPPGLVTCRTVVLSAPPRRGPHTPDGLVVVGPAVDLFDEMTLERAGEGQVFRVGPTDTKEVDLVSADRSFLAGASISTHLSVPKAALPRGCAPGSYVVVKDGRLRKASPKVRDAALASRGGILAEGLRS